LKSLRNFENAQLCIPGVVTLQIKNEQSKVKIEELIKEINLQSSINNSQCAIIVLCDDASFTAATLNNFLWVTFTRCNPANDIYGINETIENKHWGCDTVIIDARIKPHHAPTVEKNYEVEKKIDKIFAKGGSLHGII